MQLVPTIKDHFLSSNVTTLGSNMPKHVKATFIKAYHLSALKSIPVFMYLKACFSYSLSPYCFLSTMTIKAGF